MEVSLAKREEEHSYPPRYFQQHYNHPSAQETFSTNQPFGLHHECLRAHPVLHSGGEEEKKILHTSNFARSFNVDTRRLGSLQKYQYLESYLDNVPSCLDSPNSRYQADNHFSTQDNSSPFSKHPSPNSYAKSSNTSSQGLTDSIDSPKSDYLIDSHNTVSNHYTVGSHTTMNMYTNSAISNSQNINLNMHRPLTLQCPLTSSHNLLLSQNHTKHTPPDGSVLSQSLSSSSNIRGQNPYPPWAGLKAEAESNIGKSLVPSRSRRNGKDHYSTSYHTIEVPPKFGEQLQTDLHENIESKVCTPNQIQALLPPNYESEGKLRVQCQDISEDAMLRSTKLTNEGQLRLQYQDFMEIKKLKESYHMTFDLSSLPLEDRMIRDEEFGKLYSLFVQKRARFFVSSPLYKTLAASDRPKLLHIAVAMSTYFTGAHLIDTRDYTWREHLGMTKTASPIMSATTLRRFLTHEQFVHLMRFYTTYATLFSDQIVAVLMQVLSLFYPQPGLKEADMVEQGRLHYGSLLSRYLLATHGPEEGPERLKMLIVSEQEARYLVDLLQHVELDPEPPRQNLMESKRLLLEGLQTVCQEARESLTRVAKKKKERCETDVPGSCGESSSFPGISKTEELHIVQQSPSSAFSSPTSSSSSSSPVHDSERLDFIGKAFTYLASCNDPKILAEARQILPTDLVRSIFQQLV